jgi:hypothetical protein
LFKDSNILIGDEISKNAIEIKIDYLDKLKLIDILLKNQNSK